MAFWWHSSDAEKYVYVQRAKLCTPITVCSALQRNGKWERLGPPLRYYRVGEHFDLPETGVVAYRFVGLSHWRQTAAGQMFVTMSNWFDGMCNQQTPASPPNLPNLKWSTTVSQWDRVGVGVQPHEGDHAKNESRSTSRC